MRYYILLFTISLFSVASLGQTDREFWFAAPDVSSVHGIGDRNGTPIYLHVTALYATNVKISRPADPTFTPIEFPLNALEHSTIRLDNILTIDEIENYPLPLATGVQDKGFLIESDPGEITVYYELDQYYNRDIFPLKGKNALGQDFYVSTQNWWNNGNYSGTAWSGFVIVATEDNTSIQVFQNDDWLHFTSAPSTINLTLDKGETFAFRAESRTANRHINGVRVVSNKDIAITSYDDSMDEGCKDIFGDQIVPTALVGQEYIVMKGHLTITERMFVTATENNTEIFIDGVSTTTLANAGDVFMYPITNQTTHVFADKPIYLNHMTGFGCELGGALLPTIDGCTGSNDVTFTRTPNGSDSFFLNIMVRNDTADASPFKNQSIQNFTITTNGVTVSIPPNYFEFIMDSAFAVLKNDAATTGFITTTIPPGEEALVQNSNSRFHLGVINGGASTGCKYGYFSDYAQSGAAAGIGGATAGTLGLYCNMDPIQLVASGGRAYEWSGVSSPNLTQLMSDTTIAAPYFFPDTTGDFVFKVKVYGECFTDTTITMLTRVIIGPNSDFTFSEFEGCSPFTPTLTNLTSTVYADKMIWVLDDKTNLEVNQDTMPMSFPWTFPDNTSDSVQTYDVKLYAWGPFGSCPSVRQKSITVKPNITSQFAVSDSIGCQPLFVDFTNLASGHLDSTSYYWDFGDNSQSFDSLPSKTYNNFSLHDTTYTVTFVTESPFGCTDTARKDIVVHPRVRGVFANDTSFACSPLDVELNPGNSFGADTLIWSIDYWYADSTYRATNTNIIALHHEDTSLAAGPDTLTIGLIAANRFGCRDTVPDRQIVVYPAVEADFDISANEICDSNFIDFTNNSIGYKLKYEWNFDDGTVAQDSTGKSYHKAFLNRTDADTTYNIRLHAVSGFFCESSKDTVITVHPYINANFALDYTGNCAPLDVDILNNSIRVHNYNWDLGDGTTLTTSNASIPHQYWNPLTDRDTSYIVKLVASNNEGCFDSLQRQIMLLPQVVAEFNQIGIQGCSPIDVDFENLSSGSNLTYLWDFGDANSSTTTAPTFTKTYNNYTDSDTTFNISLTAINPQGCDSTVFGSVEVFATINANFNLPLSDSCSPFTIRPTNLSSTGAKIYEWDFGPGGTSNAFEPIVAPFVNTGLVEDTITVSLISYGVNDAPHRACADTHEVQVVVFPELDVDFALDNLADCQPLISNITNNTNIKSGTNFTWQLDGNHYSVLESPPAFNIPNLTDANKIHEVALYGASKYNCRDTIRQNIEVYSLVKASFTLDRPSICSGDSFFVDRTLTTGPIYNWNYNNESASTRLDNQYFFSYDNAADPNPQRKFVSLTVSNPEGCDSTWSDTITVFPLVTADFDVDDPAVCYPHQNTFTNNSTHADFYFWDMGDGSSNSNMNPTHTFNNFDKVLDEIFDIQLIARSQYNCYDSITKNVTVFAKPEADFYFPTAVDCPPFEAEMINNSAGSSLSYDWDFAGKGSSTLENPSHIFSNDSSIVIDNPITLLITSDRSCKDTLTKILRVYPNVTIDFVPNISQGCSPLNVDFTSDTSNVLQMLWYIDDAAFSTLKDPSYRFVNETPGNETYDIKFKAYSKYNCVDSLERQITVYPTPTTEFIPDPLPADYNTDLDRTPITFYNETVFQDAWSYEWNYGDGNVNNEGQAQFEYNYGNQVWGDINNNNKLRVKLFAWNADNPECNDSVWHDIIINPPLPEIDIAEDLAGCVPFTVDFASTTKYIYEDFFEWDFGADNASSGEQDPSFTYTEPGVYTVKLTVRGDGGTNWDYKIITVNPKPIVDFEMNDTIVFVKSLLNPDEYVNFYNTSQFGEYFYWYFDANNLESGMYDSDEKHPKHAYENTGIYEVALVAESGEGCFDTLIHENKIHVEGGGYFNFPTGFFVSPYGPTDETIPDDPAGAGNPYLFYPRAEGIIEYTLEVYNRWGVLVFETNDPKRGWNGYIDGSPAKQDVYIWKVKGKYANGRPFEGAGDVTLIIGNTNPVND